MSEAISVMPNSDKNIAGKRLALGLVSGAIILVLIVVLMGGWTRISDAGLSCPDWPGCFGQLTVPSTEAELAKAEQLYPNIAVEESKGWLEMLHRYLAGSLGLMILALAMLAFSYRKQAHYPHILSYSLLVLVVFQALLGMWTVTLKLLPIIVTLHLLGGLLTTILLILLRAKILTERQPPVKWQKQHYAFAIGLIVLLGQILLGGWTSSNYAGWGCSDWLACNPSLSVEYDFKSAFSLTFDTTYSHQGGLLGLAQRGAIQIVHRIGALIVVLYFFGLWIVMFKQNMWKKSCAVLVFLTTVQIILGLMSVAWAMPTGLAMAHHFVAIIMLVFITGLLAASLKKSRGVDDGKV